ncbi:uncharacterized protein LOC116136063 [Pistacia vera]|uniref:uncharacterized protein LOC116136063 n=1 Tax=Pistacia vera TaxID=55513 RepID=UPI001263C260|nr:uncharacterized protein LOC116136063 [Pistacia vera]
MVKLSKAEESLAKQKSWVKWLREGDVNTSYFIKSIAGCRNRNRIVSLEIGEDSVEWIKATYWARKSFWEILIPSNASWAWRSILKLRREAREHIKAIIGNGQATYVWHDNWHPRGPLKDRYGSRIVYDSGLHHLAKVTKSLTFGGWDVIHNYVCCPNGRIWVAWNPSLVRFKVIQSTAQAIHGKVVILDSNYFFVCSFVYGSNGSLERKELWRDLMGKAQDFEEIPWVIMGDFNAMRFGHEKIGGSYRWRSYVSDLNNMCNETRLEDLWFMGSFFTWSNMRKGEHRITTKIDRALVNEKWGCVFGKSHFGSSTFGLTMKISLALLVRLGKKKLGVPPMYQLVTKLKRVKEALKVFNKREFGNISVRVIEARENLVRVQHALAFNPLEGNLILEEKAKAFNFKSLSRDEESLARQKSRVQWLREGDQNTSYFFKCVNGRKNRNRITKFKSDNDMVFEDPLSIKEEIVSHFKRVFEKPMGARDYRGLQELIEPCITSDMANRMTAEVMDEEIKNTLFSLGNNKALGLDCFCAYFFKKAWDVVGKDVTMAIKDFFKEGKLLREIVLQLLLFPV